MAARRGRCTTPDMRPIVPEFVAHEARHQRTVFSERMADIHVSPLRASVTSTDGVKLVRPAAAMALAAGAPTISR